MLKTFCIFDYTAEGSYFVDEWRGILDGTGDRSQFKEPEEVSAAAMHFFSADAPKRRYMVVPNQGEAERTIKKAIEELVQLNEGHEYSYGRDALVKMLDEALAASGY